MGCKYESLISTMTLSLPQKIIKDSYTLDIY